MRFIALKCPSCGAEIELDESREFGFCSFCGTKVIHDKQIVEIRGSIKVDGIATTYAKLERANLLLEDYKINEAVNYFNQVLDEKPHCSAAYWGLLKAQLWCHDDRLLELEDEPLEKYDYYQKAIRFASPKELTHYQEVNNRIKSRIAAEDKAAKATLKPRIVWVTVTIILLLFDVFLLAGALNEGSSYLIGFIVLLIPICFAIYKLMQINKPIQVVQERKKRIASKSQKINRI